MIQEVADKDANIIFGTVLDESLKEEIVITVIATGFDQRPEAPSQNKDDALPFPTFQGQWTRPAEISAHGQIKGGIGREFLKDQGRSIRGDKGCQT